MSAWLKKKVNFKNDFFYHFFLWKSARAHAFTRTHTLACLTTKVNFLDGVCESNCFVSILCGKARACKHTQSHADTRRHTLTLTDRKTYAYALYEFHGQSMYIYICI